MSDRRDQFIKERSFLMSVSDHSVSWYKDALDKWLRSDSPSGPRAHAGQPPNAPNDSSR